MVLVSHDLDMVAGHADRVVVLDGGRVVEVGDVTSILTAPVHPVTRGLVHAGGLLAGGQQPWRCTSLG